MAPITATSVGIPRQTIDDPKLINLLKNLSNFDVISTNTSAKDGINTVGANASGGNVDTGNKDEDGDINMSNAEQGTEDSGAAPSSSTTQKHNEPKPPLDINGLVQELSAFPKWQFQEQVSSLYMLFTVKLGGGVVSVGCAYYGIAHKNFSNHLSKSYYV